MKGEQKKLGIVGCGNISDTHAMAISQIKKGQLIAAHSRTLSKLEKFCKRYNIVPYPSYKEFLANTDLDIAVICTPTGTHLEYGKLAAEAGKHITIEKPIEISVKRGRSLIQTCTQNDVKLSLIYQNRFIDSVIRMKKVIEQGDIGSLIMARASVKWFRSQAYYDNSSWRGTLDLDGGGAVINQSIHTLDLLQWFLGPIESVASFKKTATHEIEAEDNAIACLNFLSGAIGVFEASTSIVPPQARKIEVNGSKGTVFLEGEKFYKRLNDQKDSNGYENESVEAAGAAGPLAGMKTQNHKKQYQQILNAFQNDNEPIVSGKESLQSLALVEAIYKSADRGETVSIKEIFQNDFKQRLYLILNP
jgi:predicted dehydrogenase